MKLIFWHHLKSQVNKWLMLSHTMYQQFWQHQGVIQWEANQFGMIKLETEREKKNLQNCEMGASSWGAVPPLELSFWTCVGGTGLCDWPVARYIACTQRILSCSSSLAKITVSPSFRALKNVRPPSSPEWKEEMLLGFLFTGTFGDDMNPALMMLLHRHLFSCKQTLFQPF